MAGKGVPGAFKDVGKPSHEVTDEEMQASFKETAFEAIQNRSRNP
jgi:hypothetical protein